MEVFITTLTNQYLFNYFRIGEFKKRTIGDTLDKLGHDSLLVKILRNFVVYLLPGDFH
jgi:hypothetical protein